MAATCQSMSAHQLAMDWFVRFIMRQQRCEQWKDPFVLAGIAIKSRECKTGIMVLTAQGFTQSDRPFVVKIIWQEVVLIESDRLLQ